MRHSKLGHMAESACCECQALLGGNLFINPSLGELEQKTGTQKALCWLYIIILSKNLTNESITVTADFRSRNPSHCIAVQLGLTGVVPCSSTRAVHGAPLEAPAVRGTAHSSVVARLWGA
jgi:hypothetical protein